MAKETMGQNACLKSILTFRECTTFGIPEIYLCCEVFTKMYMDSKPQISYKKSTTLIHIEITDTASNMD